jgi:hypothetical protein
MTDFDLDLGLLSHDGPSSQEANFFDGHLHATLGRLNILRASFENHTLSWLEEVPQGESGTKLVRMRRVTIVVADVKGYHRRCQQQ